VEATYYESEEASVVDTDKTKAHAASTNASIGVEIYRAANNNTATDSTESSDEIERPQAAFFDFTSIFGFTQARITKAEFLSVLQHMRECSKQAKVFAKKLHEDYKAKACGIPEAYQRFEQFSETLAPPEGLPEVSNVELQLCLDEYQDDAEVRQAWQQSGAEANMILQSMASNGAGAFGGSRPSSMPEQDRKKGKTKPSDIIEMQELMVDELKRLNEATSQAIKKGGSQGHEWKPELLTQMIQALASAAVERRFNVSQEEMTMLGVQHANFLQRSERFARATQNQQEILMKIPELCQAASAS